MTTEGRRDADRFWGSMLDLTPTKPVSEAGRTYWDTYLEHNPLRAPPSGRGPETDAGAYIAYILEGAGDIYRELYKYPYADRNYIFEKFNRIRDNLTGRDWIDPLSDKELGYKADIRRILDGLPAETEVARLLKSIMIDIIDRNPRAIEGKLPRLRELLIATLNEQYKEVR